MYIKQKVLQKIINKDYPEHIKKAAMQMARLTAPNNIGIQLEQGTFWHILNHLSSSDNPLTYHLEFILQFSKRIKNQSELSKLGTKSRNLALHLYFSELINILSGQMPDIFHIENQPWYITLNDVIDKKLFLFKGVSAQDKLNAYHQKMNKEKTNQLLEKTHEIAELHKSNFWENKKNIAFNNAINNLYKFAQGTFEASLQKNSSLTRNELKFLPFFFSLALKFIRNPHTERQHILSRFAIIKQPDDSNLIKKLVSLSSQLQLVYLINLHINQQHHLSQNHLDLIKKIAQFAEIEKIPMNAAGIKNESLWSSLQYSRNHYLNGRSLLFRKKYFYEVTNALSEFLNSFKDSSDLSEIKKTNPNLINESFNIFLSILKDAIEEDTTDQFNWVKKQFFYKQLKKCVYLKFFILSKEEQQRINAKERLEFEFNIFKRNIAKVNNSQNKYIQNLAERGKALAISLERFMNQYNLNTDQLTRLNSFVITANKLLVSKDKNEHLEDYKNKFDDIKNIINFEGYSYRTLKKLSIAFLGVAVVCSLVGIVMSLALITGGSAVLPMAITVGGFVGGPLNAAIISSCTAITSSVFGGVLAYREVTNDSVEKKATKMQEMVHVFKPA